MKCNNNKFKTVTLKLLQLAKFAFRSYSHSWKNVLPKLKIVYISANVDLLCVCARVCSWGNVIDAFFSLPLSVLMSTHHHLCLYTVKIVSYALCNFALLELCTDWNQYVWKCLRLLYPEPNLTTGRKFGVVTRKSSQFPQRKEIPGRSLLYCAFSSKQVCELKPCASPNVDYCVFVYACVTLGDSQKKQRWRISLLRILVDISYIRGCGSVNLVQQKT